MARNDSAAVVALSKSQQNIYTGVLQDPDPGLYLIGRRYTFEPIGLQRFLRALRATIRRTPVQLCVLRAGGEYPVLAPCLRAEELISVGRLNAENNSAAALQLAWADGILDRPLVHYTVFTDDADECVVALHVHSHHILIDGVGTGIVESILGGYLAGAEAADDVVSTEAGLRAVCDAHRCEAEKVHDALPRLEVSVKAEMTADARRNTGYASDATSGSAAKGVLVESATLTGTAYSELVALAEQECVPLNVLVATAALAVNASRRQSTDGLLIHTVDNRFGDPELDVATCLVNSVAHTVEFPAFASVAAVARIVDRGYVKALKRRWLREEHYRRMFLAINHTSHIETQTLNFLLEPCAPALRPFLTEAPVTTDIGPVEGPTVAAVLDAQEHRLSLGVWDRLGAATGRGLAARIAQVLTLMPAMWDQPFAMTVDEWLELADDGSLTTGRNPPEPELVASAWFTDPRSAVDDWVAHRRFVTPWVGWLVDNEVARGEVLVIVDDNSDATIDLLVAAHLAGCAYSVCERADQIVGRADAIAEATGGRVRVVDIPSAVLQLDVDGGVSEHVRSRVRRIAHDATVADGIAYLMATSGTTGAPKLVPVTHRALALFCHALRDAYGWTGDDVILQCASLASDISIEEVFGAAYCGVQVLRSPSVKTADLQALSDDVIALGPTVIDLPTGIWHVLCEDPATLASLGASNLRQIIIGGEPVRLTSVDRFVDGGPAHQIDVISTYGPTETTVVITELPIVTGGRARDPRMRSRLGRPLVPNSVFIAFGEVVVVGEIVSPGYLGASSSNFGTVQGTGTTLRAFATNDRVIIDDRGFPCFAGRRDAVVKIAGKRVDTAALSASIAALPDICDVAVEAEDGRLGVWLETHRTREGAEDPAAATAARRILADAGVPAFVAVEVPKVFRKPNGKVDGAKLRALPAFRASLRDTGQSATEAAALAQLWSHRLDRPVFPHTSLLDEGIGSLDLIRILPATRRFLGRPISILDLISADSAVAVLEMASQRAWVDEPTLDRIAQDYSALLARVPAPVAERADTATRPLLILGASGVLGTGFGNAIADMSAARAFGSEIILATRSSLPDTAPWAALRRTGGVDFRILPSPLRGSELADFVRGTGAGTVINCIGNANMVVPYEDLYVPNVELVSALVDVCVGTGAKLVHLSTYSIAAEVSKPSVLDPRNAPYPYAASKALAELVIAAAPDALDYVMVRLPRVLPGEAQLRSSSDVLVSVVHACRALGARPVGAVTEEVTTADAAARAILGLLTNELGRSVAVLRGDTVHYDEILGSYVSTELAIEDWKAQLDGSEWAQRNARRWSVIDGWISLGDRLGERTYAEYLSQYRTIALDVRAVSEITSVPRPIVDVLRAGIE